MLVIVVVILLVTASFGIGALTAHWPFWRRAWVWHAADGGWPEQALPGPHAVVRGGGAAPLDFAAAGEELSRVAAGANTHLLLRVSEGRAEAWSAPGFDAQSVIDGRGLAVAVLHALFMRLESAQPGLLDRPVGAWLERWRQDVRGGLTVRELLAEVGQGIEAPPARTPLNPFSARARLASGPGYAGAALAIYSSTGSEDRRAAAAQLLAAVAAAIEGARFTSVLQEWLWWETAAGDARVALDSRNGDAAAHCCLLAAAADWLRIGLVLAGAAADEVRIVRTAGRVLVAGAGGALLWVGEGPPPSGLEMLLPTGQPSHDTIRLSAAVR